MTKRRGGQRGNTNALKHGFYSSQFKAAESRVLDGMSLTELAAEIELMRIATRRFVQAQAELPEGGLDFEAHLAVLRAISLSVDSINRMVRAQLLIARNQPEDRRLLLEKILVSLKEVQDSAADGA
jgi:hypothetical protein